MSEMETFKGRLTPVELDGLTVDQWVQELLGWTELDLNRYEDWLDALSEERYGEYVYDRLTSTVYEIQKHQLDPYGFVEAERRSDGSIDFIVSYYNGGVSFSEVAKSAIRSAS